MRLTTFFILLNFIFSPLSGQIVNIESLRSFVDTNGFHGTENLSLDYKKNTRELLDIANNLSLKYQNQRHVWLFLNTLQLQAANKTVLDQNLLFHLRYNYKQNKWLTYEVLSQFQKNIPLRIDSRILLGFGPRFKLYADDVFSILLGVIGMYEYDEELENQQINRTARLSNYVVLNIDLQKRFSWTNVVYYQPRFDKLEDFRSSVQSQLLFKITKNLGFTTTLNLNYDAFPVDDPNIPLLTLAWVNGVSYRF